jgi:hypothetical protein
MPRLVQADVHRAEVNCVPLSVVTCHRHGKTCHLVGNEGVHTRAGLHVA